MNRSPQNEAERQQMESLNEARMSIIEHLTELRTRILYSLGFLLLGTVLAWFWVEDLFTWLLYPLEVGAPQLDLAKMHHKDLAEPIFAFIKTAILAGVFLASPGILYNIWKFIAPGLYDSERKVAIPFVVAATLFFFGGAAFCFFIVMPYGFKFLLTFALDVSDPTLMMSEYFSLATKLLFGFGLIFEMPVFSMFLASIGVITHRTLLKYWRVAIVCAFVAAAIFTPPDVITQGMMAGPLILLYFLSVGVAWFFSRDSKTAEADEGEDAEDGDQ